MSRGLIVLYAENPRIGMILDMQMRSLGFFVAELEDEKIFRMVLNVATPSLILLAMMDPIDLCRHIRGHGHLAHVPLVALSARATLDNELAVLDAGATEFITMPWEQTGLTLRISNLIKVAERRHKEELVAVANEARLSVFVSYGGPDEAFAKKLDAELRERGVKRTFLFCRDAIPGKRLHRVMKEAVNEHDRVVLICSRDSLDRPGVLNEIEEAFQREAREGGSTILIPVTLDDYLFTEWAPERRDLVDAIRDRVVANFTSREDPQALAAAIDLLLEALAVSSDPNLEADPH